MIEQIVRNYIETKLNIPSYLDAPTKKPDRYYKIRKSGASGDKFIETAIFIIYSVSTKSLFDAADMNDKLKNAIYSIPSEVATVSYVELNTDGNFTDTETKEYRYQAIFEITYHR